MTVVSCNNKPWKGRSTHLHVEVGGKSINAIQREIVEAFQVLTDSPADSAVIVTSSPLVPQLMYSVHPDYPLAICTAMSATQPSGSPCDWLLLVTYSTIQPQQGSDNPLARPDQVRWEPQPRRTAVEWMSWGGIEDVNRNQLEITSGAFASGEEYPLAIGDSVPIINAAGDAFDPGIYDDDFDLVATVTRNVSYVPLWLLQYAAFPASVNQAPLLFGGISMDIATLKILPPRVSELKTENQVQYYTLEMQFAYRPDGWDYRILNLGFNKRIPDDTIPGKKVPITIRGVNVNTPQLLDQNGGAMIGVTADVATYCVFQRPRDDFSVIRLPPT